MRTLLLVAGVGTALAAFSAPVLRSSAPLTAAPLTTASPTTAPRTAAHLTEAQRHVVQHLDGALALLAERDVAPLSAAQRERREHLIGLLREYRDAGRFPENRDFTDEYVPYFVDRETGAICAVGHLMAATGHRGLVTRIAEQNNHVRIRELAEDAEVVAWLDQHGLTLAEAARIQPQYAPFPEILEEPSPAVGQSVTLSLAGASWLLSGMQLASRADLAMGQRIAPLGLFASSLTFGAAILNRNALGSDATSEGAFMIGAAGLLISGATLVRARTSAASGTSVAGAGVPHPASRRWQFAPTTDGRTFVLAARLRF